MAEGGYVHHARIGRMDAHAGDVSCVSETDVGPGLSGVGGAVDAVPMGNIASNARLAGACIENIGV